MQIPVLQICRIHLTLLFKKMKDVLKHGNTVVKASIYLYVLTPEGPGGRQMGSGEPSAEGG